MTTTANTPVASADPAEPVRQVRLRVPERTYRALRHRMADAAGRATISDVVLELIDIGLQLG